MSKKWEHMVETLKNSSALLTSTEKEYLKYRENGGWELCSVVEYRVTTYRVATTKYYWKREIIEPVTDNQVKE